MDIYALMCRYKRLRIFSEILNIIGNHQTPMTCFGIFRQLILHGYRSISISIGDECVYLLIISIADDNAYRNILESLHLTLARIAIDCSSKMHLLTRTINSSIGHGVTSYIIDVVMILS